MVSVCYVGQYPTGGTEGNNDTISMLNIDGTVTLIKLVSANEVVAKYVTESRALFLKKDGSTPVGKKDYHLTYLSHEFLQEEIQHVLEETVNGLIQKAEKDGKIPIIAVALHGPVSQPSAHESEERIIKTVQDLGYLSTEGEWYMPGNSSDKTPYARSWLVLGIGIVPALEEGRLFLSLGGTACFQDSMIKQLKLARDRKKWAMPKKATSKKPTSSSSSSRQVLVLPRELSHYNKIQFTGNCSSGSDKFNRELATKQLTPLLSPSKSKKLLVVGTGGKNSKKHLAATSNPNWDIWNLEKFKKYNFGFGYDGKPTGQSSSSSKKRSIEDVN